MTNTSIEATPNESSAFMLGEVEVRPDSLTLVVGGEERRVEPRVMDLLVYGSERAGQLLSRQQINKDVWGGVHTVPEAVQRVVSILRKCLGDDPRNPEFIETLSSKGYRFLMVPKPVSGSGSDEVKMTEQRIRVSPLTVLMATLIIVLLTWLVLSRFENDVFAPLAEPDKSAQPVGSAPVPQPENG